LDDQPRSGDTLDTATIMFRPSGALLFLLRWSHGSCHGLQIFRRSAATAMALCGI